MFKNYFVSAYRSLMKKKFYTAINLFGLTTGLTCCILIFMYIANEVSYDQFHEKKDRITRVIMEYSFGGSVTTGNYTSTKVLPAFKRQFPEIEEGVRMTETERIISYEDKLFTEKKVMFADSTFFQVFTMPLVQGNTQTALSGANKVVLTRSTATKYFGQSAPVGKLLLMGTSKIPCEVTGIMNDCPVNSQMRFDMLVSFSSLQANQEQTYWNANYTTYLLLRKPTDIKPLQAKIPGFMKAEMKDQGNVYLTYFLEPLLDIHLRSPYDSFEPNNNILYIYIITGVAFLMLLIACFTYINLNTARSLERAREVGIRKTIGAAMKQIFWQFMGESALITFLAVLLSLAAVWLLLPFFNTLSGKTLQVNMLFTPVLLGAIAVCALVIVLLSGSYPALVVSRFQPIKVLKGSFSKSASGARLTKSLTVFQFVISFFLLVSTFVVQKQIHYIRNKKMGFNREQVLMLPSDRKILAAFATVKTELKRIPGVQYVSRAQNAPHNIVGGYNMRNAAMASNAQLNVKANPVDEEYVPASGLEVLYGSNFSEQDINTVQAYDEHTPENAINYPFIINETAAKALGWSPSEAVGKKMFLDDSRPGYVKAVIRDFNFESIHHAIGPLVLFPAQWSSVILVKLDGKDVQGQIRQIGSTWKQVAPHRPFEYKFLDDEFNKMYNAELRLGEVFNLFTGISILLACIGLLGLCSYAAQQRVKEIGIRKIMGAGVGDIVRLLSRDFFRLASISMLIAFPVAYWVVYRWLEAFAYRVSISWWIFAISALIGFFLVFITTGLLAVRAATANPVKSLRTE
ncbi:MAG: FtsX-like permease family protein [Chitinophagaceae bacterium]|nr:FtsX-like permease family protein [Chitinophagaceae bacterium]